MVQFIGYGGGRGLPANHTLFPSVGYAAFVMDTRGQGGRWTVGATGDLAPGPEYSSGDDPGHRPAQDYYYTRLYVDAVQRRRDGRSELDGAGQLQDRGERGTARAALSRWPPPRCLARGSRPCHADVPFLCDIQRPR